MFLNATLLSLYAQARRDEDLRDRRILYPTEGGIRPLLRRLRPRRLAPAPQPVPQPR